MHILPDSNHGAGIFYLQNWVILDTGKCWDSYSSIMVRIWVFVAQLVNSLTFNAMNRTLVGSDHGAMDSHVGA